MLLFALLHFLLIAAKAAHPSEAALSLYGGTWQISQSGSAPYQLANQCEAIGKYFACQQSVNGKVSGLLVFIPADQPGRYWTQTILPEGRATGRDSLEISGNRWTYTSSRQEGSKTTYYRTTHIFAGNNRIHFEQAESTDGKQWTVKNQGDQTKLK
jgi:hypothetical protein